MAKTESSMLPLGTEAPTITLPDTNGMEVSSQDYADAPVLIVAFICNHCPYVKHIRHELAAFGRKALDRGAAMLAINANDAERYPADAPETMAAEKARVGYPFPYLYDADQAIAKAFGAACTPEFFVFDDDRRLVYRGRFDASTPGRDASVTGEDLSDAVDAALKGHDVAQEQYPSLGCGIKWKPGNEPAYAG